MFTPKSFQIDHTVLRRGLYISDTFVDGTNAASIFDLRMRAPYQERPLSPAVSHTIEHLGAHYLRADKERGKDVIYFGPMGCLTGFYLILSGAVTLRAAKELVIRAFNEAGNHKGTIPGRSKLTCGNYRCMDPLRAKTEIKKYVHLLECPVFGIHHYPYISR